MAKEKIPLYRLSHLAAPAPAPSAAGGLAMPGEFMIESFGPYLERQSPHLHYAHRHIFYHLVCFTHGAAIGQKQQVVEQFRRLIDEHYKTLRLPGEYARLLHITPNHLNALCQEFLGRPAGAVIRDRVLLEAKRLLTNADMTAAEIAYELNFQDNSYFSRFFKKYEGVTPEGFRRTAFS